MKRKLALGVLVGTAAAAGYGLRVGAEGAPVQQPLFYAGTLEDNGAPAEGAYELSLTVHDAEAGGNELCASQTADVPVKAGRFRIDASDCAEALRSNAEAWVALSFTGGDGVPHALPRAKIGAVPYTLEADHAVSASKAVPGGELAASLVPKGMIGMFAAACPQGWIPCDGSGDCPDLMGGFIKAGSAFAGLTGTSSHTHSVAAGTTGSAGNVTPEVASASANTAGQHSHVAMIDNGVPGNVTWRSAPSPASWTADSFFAATVTGGSAAVTGGVDTTSAPGHTHAVQVTMRALPGHTHSTPMQATNSAEHEPRNATLVPCMKQ